MRRGEPGGTPRRLRDGQPVDLDAAMVMVEQAFGRRPRRLRSTPVPHGGVGSVHRLRVTLDTGRATLLFEDTLLSDTAAPVLAGYPGSPGLPQWDLLSQVDAAVQSFLPEVHAAREAKPGVHYRYLLQDVASTHRPPSTIAEVDEAVDALGAVHDALSTWAETRRYTPRLDHGPDAAEARLDYVRVALAGHQAADPDARTDRFLRHWEEVASTYLAVEEVSSAVQRIIHGDPGAGNLLIGEEGPKLVAWDWMGSGPAHVDLAAVLEWSPWDQQRAAVRRFFAGDADFSHDDHWRVFLWASLGRSLLGAARHARRPASRERRREAIGAYLGAAERSLAALQRVALWAPDDRPGPAASTSRSTRVGSPRVTIGLPVYNGDRFLEEVIESHLAQTFTDFELIISDNGSTDRTQEIGEAFAARDPRVVYSRLDRNIGAHHNYNRLVAMARGEYFKWSADDDLCAPTFLERCVQALDAVPDAVLAYPQRVDIDESSRIIRDRPVYIEMEGADPVSRFRSHLRGGSRACYPIFGLFRHDTLRRSRLLGHYADSDRVLLGELALHGAWRQIPEPLFLHRQHDGRSIRQYPDPRRRGAWFDPARRGPDPFAWKRLAGFWSAVGNSPLCRSGRFAAYKTVAFRWGMLESPHLVRDLVALLAAPLHGLGAGHRGGSVARDGAR